MKSNINREDGLKLLRKYNPESFHILHGLTVAGVMQWFANEYGYRDDSEYWYMVGLMHDIDFGMFPRSIVRNRRKFCERRVLRRK